MPKVSKVRAATTRPGEASPPKELLDKYMCSRCGQIYKRQRGNFPSSQSPLYRGNGGWLTICNHCIDDLLEHYKSVLSSEKEAMKRVCMKYDIYWSPEIYSIVSKANTSNSRIRSYISKTNLIKFVGKTYDDTLDEEIVGASVSYAARADDECADKPVDPENIPSTNPDIIDFWGPGFTPKIYYDLDRRYKKWTSGKAGDIDESSAALYKQICLCEVNIARNMMVGKPIEAAQKSMNELLGSLNAKPIQKKQEDAANEPFDNLPFGVGIKMCENVRPIPKPDPRFDDVDGIVKYISIWFLGHLCKMLNIRNTYCKLYENAIAKMKVERPDLDDEEDETVFNEIFGDNTYEEEAE